MHWGNNEASDEEIYKYLELACAKSIVDKKTEGLDYLVSQNGKNLSGGEKQRLSITRTLLKKPQILILDDSTSALDYLTEYNLRQNLKQLDYKLGVLTDVYIKHNHIVKDDEMNNIQKRRFHNKCTLESKKYYMLEVRNINKNIWRLSYILDWSTRFIKDVYLMIFK